MLRLELGQQPWARKEERFPKTLERCLGLYLDSSDWCLEERKWIE